MGRANEGGVPPAGRARPQVELREEHRLVEVRVPALPGGLSGVALVAYSGIFSFCPGWMTSGSFSWSRFASKIRGYFEASP